MEDLLAHSLRGTDHVLERTSDALGHVLGSKKGDFVITLDPDTMRGASAADRRGVQGPRHVRPGHAR